MKLPRFLPRVAAAAERTVQICAVLLSIVFLASGVAYLCLGYWSVTQNDYWRIYEICLNHSWLQSALLKFHDHSLFFPSFIWLADLRFFHGNQGLVFFVGLALLLISTSLLLVPVWRDGTVGLTAKLLTTLALIVGSFWMGRAPITVSGGFNCIASLVILGVALAFLWLPKMCAGSPQLWRATAIVVCAGFVASFSFGTGLAIWPCLLLFGWGLRLPWRSLGLIAAGAITAALIYHWLPPGDENYLIPGGTNSPGLVSILALTDLCKLVGGPLFYAVRAWHGAKPTGELAQSSGWLLWSGAVGVALAAAVVVPRLVRRDLKGNSLEFTGVLLISFNLCSLILVVAGRIDYFRTQPFEVATPRYLFWSSLFWTGLLTVLICYGARTRWLRWPIFLVALMFPAASWARHREEGFGRRYARMRTEEFATGLINGVNDPGALLPGAGDMKVIDALTPQLRSLRLDMFAEGLQDWIGQPVSQLFGGRQDPGYFRGRASMQRLVGGRDQGHAVKISGQLFAQEGQPQPTMVILDPRGTVVGIARSIQTNKFLNRLLYGGRMPNGSLTGYIRDYNPALQYVLRAAGENGVSQQQIVIAPLPRQPTR